MKAVIINKHGGPEVLEYVGDFPDPNVGDNEVLVSIKARSLNRIEIVARNGYPGLNINLPHVLGPDGSGEVVTTGKNVKLLKRGDRVVVYPVIVPEEDEFTEKGLDFMSPSWKYVGLHTHGTYAEYVSLPQECLVKIPDTLDFISASSLPTAGLTAYHGLKNVASLSAGDTFFVWGATGGVGVFAIQIAKHLGAKVVAATSKESKKQKLYDIGADFVVNSESDDVAAKVKEFTGGRGVDVVLDYVGPATFQKSFDMLKKGGKILLCGQLTGRETNFSIHMTYFKHISILGFYLGAKQEMEEFVHLVSAGKIKPIIHDTMKLKDMQSAHRIMEKSEHFGKIVII